MIGFARMCPSYLGKPTREGFMLGLYVLKIFASKLFEGIWLRKK